MAKATFNSGDPDKPVTTAIMLAVPTKHYPNPLHCSIVTALEIQKTYNRLNIQLCNILKMASATRKEGEDWRGEHTGVRADLAEQLIFRERARQNPLG